MLATWRSLALLNELDTLFRPKQAEPVVPRGLEELSWRVVAYEDAIRRRWDEAKEDIAHRGDVAVQDFIDWMVQNAHLSWEPAILAMFEVEAMTPEIEARFREEFDQHLAYMRDSLQPDILTRVREEDEERSLLERLAALDHRVVAMYAGALWSAGSLLFAVFDGVQARDLAALFMFIGPNDEATCTGDRGCDQYANRIFPLAQILAEEIIPGRMTCITNCRHYLLPIVRIPAEEAEGPPSLVAEEIEFEREVLGL